MKKINTLILAMLISNGVMAEVELPYGITSLNGEIKLLYRPGFEARCSANNPEGQEIPSVSITSLALDSVGRLNYRLTMDDVTAIFDINEDGFGLMQNEPRFQSANAAEVESKTKDLLLNIIKLTPPGYGVIGKTLRQNSDIAIPDVCNSIPEAKNDYSSVKRKVIGTTFIRGRSSLIIKSDIELGCSFQGRQKISFGIKGWESFDLQSGLVGSSNSNIIIRLGGSEKVNMIKSDCVISDTLQTSTSTTLSSTGGKSTEQRLIELKSLMDRGLITQEQYEQKRTDIIKSL